MRRALGGRSSAGRALPLGLGRPPRGCRHCRQLVDAQRARHLAWCVRSQRVIVRALGGRGVVAPGGGDLNGGAPLHDQAEAGGGGKPVALAGGVSWAVVGVIVVFPLFLADGGVVAGVFPGQIRRAGLIAFSGAAGLLLEGIGHQKARGVPDGGRLGQAFLPAAPWCPAWGRSDRAGGPRRAAGGSGRRWPWGHCAATPETGQAFGLCVFMSQP